MDKNLTILLMLVIFLTIAKVGLAESNFEVTGIMAGNPPIAIVNGQVVQKGDKVDQAEVVNISKDSVILKYQHKVIVSGINKSVQKNNTQNKIVYTNQVSQLNFSNKNIDEKINERVNSDYERMEQIDEKREAKEQAEKDRKNELKIAEIEAKAYVVAAQGREYDTSTDIAYQRGTLRLEQKDDEQSQ